MQNLGTIALILSYINKSGHTFLLCQHPDSIAEVNHLLKEMKFDELRDVMMSPLSFGTAGNAAVFSIFWPLPIPKVIYNNWFHRSWWVTLSLNVMIALTDCV